MQKMNKLWKITICKSNYDKKYIVNELDEFLQSDDAHIDSEIFFDLIYFLFKAPLKYMIPIKTDPIVNSRAYNFKTSNVDKLKTILVIKCAPKILRQAGRKSFLSIECKNLLKTQLIFNKPKIKHCDPIYNEPTSGFICVKVLVIK